MSKIVQARMLPAIKVAITGLIKQSMPPMMLRMPTYVSFVVAEATRKLNIG